ncbi:MAG: EamA family transporter [Pleurocapsa sp. SU_196_0]|nr:EamA family transporter [Pleurocapsa sp. SU_196_0]
MNAALLPIALIVGSVVLYQVSQKLLPENINPWHALMLYYLLAFVMTVAATLVDRPSQNFLESVRQSNWAVPLVALSIVGIEVGWILAFRTGGSLSLTGLIVNVAVAVVVIPIGLLFFKEKISLVNIAGMVLCVVGLILISRRA